MNEFLAALGGVSQSQIFPELSPGGVSGPLRNMSTSSLSRFGQGGSLPRLKPFI